MNAAPEMIVGIDLGTTNTALAWAPRDGSAEPSILQLEQQVARAERDVRPLLPSFLYAPTDAERAGSDTSEQWVVGEYARERGQEVPGRLVASAKSWLCHPGVDRQAAILPWAPGDADNTVPKLSPVAASERILRHLQQCWRRAFPARPLTEQQIVLTVPASFDEVARELTVQAATEAGLQVRLLEEPQAAFYDYLRRSGTAELEAVLASSASALVLVCDVGGGTTDLTLLRVTRDAAARIAVERVAVGRHLLLGGDNIDLALAQTCEERLVTRPDRLEASRFAQLVLACRAAKEKLLGSSAPDQIPIRLLGSGSALVGSTLSTTLTRAEVETLVFEGFLPLVEHEAAAARRRSGLLAFGLPYEVDPRITRHVCDFVVRSAGQEPIAAVLLNGGLFRAERVATRLLEVLSRFTSHAPSLLTHADPDLAVARGAAAYGLALHGHGLRIAGGAAFGYYVGLERAGAEQLQALCVVPRGAQEGERHRASAHGLALRVGQVVRFDLFAADTGPVHAPGQVVPVDDQFDALPPLVTRIDASGLDAGSELRVAVEGELTPIGTVELSCVEASAAQPRRFRLAFDLRSPKGSVPPPPSQTKARGPERGDHVEKAREAVERVFGKGRKDVKPRETKDLVRELERLLGERAKWTVEQSRMVFDWIAPKHNARRRSVEHERVFWMLVGFCLRPGFGHPRDRERVALLAPLASQLLAFPQEARGWQQFWICWRRIAGGLDEATQVELRNLIDPFWAPAELKLKRPKGLKPLAEDEMKELVSWLERVPADGRALAGRWLLEETWTSRDPRLWAAIGRLGARVPAYASVHHVVATAVVDRWLDHLLREKWNEVSSAARAAWLMARVTGDRVRDLAEPRRLEVAERLRACGSPPEWAVSVSEYVPLAESERADRFGEELPSGLRLLEDKT